MIGEVKIIERVVLQRVGGARLRDQNGRSETVQVLKRSTMVLISQQSIDCTTVQKSAGGGDLLDPEG